MLGSVGMTVEVEEEVVGERTTSSYTATGAVENSKKHGGAIWQSLHESIQQVQNKNQLHLGNTL